MTQTYNIEVPNEDRSQQQLYMQLTIDKHSIYLSALILKRQGSFKTKMTLSYLP